MARSRSDSRTRFGQPGPDRRPEEAGRDAVDGGERDDRGRAVDERQRGERRRRGRGRRRSSAGAARAGRRAARASARSRRPGGSRRSGARRASVPTRCASKTSTDSASAARYVPTADAAVARKSSPIRTVPAEEGEASGRLVGHARDASTRAADEPSGRWGQARLGRPQEGRVRRPGRSACRRRFASRAATTPASAARSASPIGCTADVKTSARLGPPLLEQHGVEVHLHARTAPSGRRRRSGTRSSSARASGRRCASPTRPSTCWPVPPRLADDVREAASSRRRSLAAPPGGVRVAHASGTPGRSSRP